MSCLKNEDTFSAIHDFGVVADCWMQVGGERFLAIGWYVSYAGAA
jgi:hypothetical protein